MITTHSNTTIKSLILSEIWSNRHIIAQITSRHYKKRSKSIHCQIPSSFTPQSGNSSQYSPSSFVFWWNLTTESKAGVHRRLNNHDCLGTASSVTSQRLHSICRRKGRVQTGNQRHPNLHFAKISFMSSNKVERGQMTPEVTEIWEQALRTFRGPLPSNSA